MLLRLTRLRGQHASLQPSKQAADSQVCLADATQRAIADSGAEFGMPYGLPPLSSAQVAALQAWIERGAPGPSSGSRPERAAIPETLRGEVQAWEQFLNDFNPRQQLVSRYLYEHLFLASLHFASSTPSTGPVSRPPVFRLVRSRTACDNGIDEIATRRPTDAPGSLEVFYCLRPVTGAIVEKTHIPYELSPRKLERIKCNSSGTTGTRHARVSTATTRQTTRSRVRSHTGQGALPVPARRTWFHVATFIKGPACNGSVAVNPFRSSSSSSS